MAMSRSVRDAKRLPASRFGVSFAFAVVCLYPEIRARLTRSLGGGEPAIKAVVAALRPGGVQRWREQRPAAGQRIPLPEPLLSKLLVVYPWRVAWDDARGDALIRAEAK